MFRHLALTLAAVALCGGCNVELRLSRAQFACDYGGACPSDAGPGLRAKDATTIAPSPDATPPDVGGLLGCGHNPNGCAPHELVGPSPRCTCLGACESGWRWDPMASACAPAHSADAGVVPPDAGVAPPDAQVAPPDAGVPPVDTFDPRTVSAALAEAQCSYTARCEPALLAYLQQTQPACVAEQTAQNLATYVLFPAMFNAGRLGFSQSALDNCLRAFNGADCHLGIEPSPCAEIFTGAQPVGQPCAFSLECRAEAYCSAAATGQCGQCTLRAQAGEGCSTSACAQGTRCMEVTNQGQLCIPDRGGLGDACGEVQTGLCRGRLQCVGDQSFTCQRPAAAGAMCTGDSAAQPACNIHQSSTCAGGTCSAVSWVGPGASCDPPNQCNRLGRCDMPAGGTCVAWPSAGETCFMGQCAPDHYCDVANCVRLKPRGATCIAGAECSGNLFCVNGACGDLSWTRCP